MPGGISTFIIVKEIFGMNYNVTVNGKVYAVTVEKTGAAAPGS